MRLHWDDHYDLHSWWRHQMVTFSALLDIFVGNSIVTGEFTAQRPVTLSFDVFLIYTWINSRVNNRKVGDLRRHSAHYDVTVRTAYPTYVSGSVTCLQRQIFGNQSMNPKYWLLKFTLPEPHTVVIIALTHWCRVALICVGKSTIIVLDNVLSPGLGGAKPLSEPMLEYC